MLNKIGVGSKKESSDIEYSDSVLIEKIHEFLPTTFQHDLAILAFIFAAFFVKGCFLFASLGISASLRAELLFKTKARLTTAVAETRLEEFYSKNRGDITNLVNEQANRALIAFSAFCLTGVYFINAIFYIIFAFSMSITLGLSATILGGLIVPAFLKLNRIVQEISLDFARENGVITQNLVQFIAAKKYLTSTNQALSQIRHISTSAKRLATLQFKSGLAGAFTQAIKEPVAVLCVVVVIAVSVETKKLRQS